MGLGVTELGSLSLNAQFLAQIVHVGLNGLDLLFLRFKLIFQNLDAIESELLALFEAVTPIRFGNGIGKSWPLRFCLRYKR